MTRYLALCVCVCVWCVHMCIFWCVYACVCVCVCVCVYVCVCVCTHVYTQHITESFVTTFMLPVCLLVYWMVHLIVRLQTKDYFSLWDCLCRRFSVCCGRVFKWPFTTLENFDMSALVHFCLLSSFLHEPAQRLLHYKQKTSISSIYWLVGLYID